MTMRPMAVAVTALLALLVACPLTGQANAGDRGDRRLHISLYAGTTGPGPAAQLEEMFVRANYDQTAGCNAPGCGSRSFPYSVTGWGQIGLPFTLGVRSRVVGPVEVGLLTGRTPIGETAGYHYPSEVDLEFGVTFVAATAGVWIPIPLPRTPRIHVSGGPAWYNAFWTPLRDNNKLSTKHQRTTGSVARAGFEVSVDGPVLIGFDFQYRSVGTITVGPITSATLDLPATPAHFDHWCASIGFSVGL
jgi:hypothetical protein